MHYWNLSQHWNITLFISITMLRGTDIILHKIPQIHTERGEYYAKYCQSCKTLLRFWIMWWSAYWWMDEWIVLLACSLMYNYDKKLCTCKQSHLFASTYLNRWPNLILTHYTLSNNQYYWKCYSTRRKWPRELLRKMHVSTNPTFTAPRARRIGNLYKIWPRFGLDILVRRS